MTELSIKGSSLLFRIQEASAAPFRTNSPVTTHHHPAQRKTAAAAATISLSPHSHPLIRSSGRARSQTRCWRRARTRACSARRALFVARPVRATVTHRRHGGAARSSSRVTDHATHCSLFSTLPKKPSMS